MRPQKCDHQFSSMPTLQETSTVQTNGSLTDGDDFSISGKVYQYLLGYVSGLLGMSWSHILDAEQLSNDIIFEFLERYSRGDLVKDSSPIQINSLINTIARTRTINAIRDARRKRRCPANNHRHCALDENSLDQIDSSQIQASNEVELKEVLEELERLLEDRRKADVFKLMVLGHSMSEICMELKLPRRTCQRLIANVRAELQPWCESNLSLRKEQRSKGAKE